MLDPKPQILILSAQAGSGHMSLATALADLLAAHAVSTIAEPLPRTIATQYRLMSRYARWLYAAGYAITDTPRRAFALHRLFARLLAPALDALLRQQPYQLVAATHPFLSYAAMRAIG